MNYLVFGIVTGSILAIASVGFSMTRQTEGFLNIAHGQYLALGAYLGLLFNRDMELPIWLSAALAMVAVGIVGMVVAQSVFRPVRGKGPLAQLFTSVGVAYVLYGCIILAFGPKIGIYPVSFGPRVEILGFAITYGEAAIIGIAGASVLVLHLFLTRSSLGLWILAVASDPELAAIRGVPTVRVSLAVGFVSSALAGLAGVLVGMLGSVGTEIGWHNILLILAAAVLGGLGRIYGVIAAGLILGIATDMSALVIPTGYRTVVAFGALILVLMFRPEGLFSIQQRKQAA